MNQPVISISEHNGIPMVESHEVARRFGKRHQYVLAAYDNLQIPESFRLTNFRECSKEDRQGIQRRSLLMTKNGFSLLAFGFTGEKALEWKVRFLEAFDAMQAAIPELQARIKVLESEKAALIESAQPRMLTAGKRPSMKDMVLVPVIVDTMFGQELEWHKAPRNDERFSELSRMEGQIKNMMNCMAGMQRKIQELTDKIAIERRK